jgi:hypothetical protein
MNLTIPQSMVFACNSSSSFRSFFVGRETSSLLVVLNRRNLASVSSNLFWTFRFSFVTEDNCCSASRRLEGVEKMAEQSGDPSTKSPFIPIMKSMSEAGTPMHGGMNEKKE